MNDFYERLYVTGVVPVIVFDKAEDAVPTAQALLDGGLAAAEVTFRTACAAEAIRAIREKFGDTMLVGAGTVLTEEQVQAAIDAGAQFIVTPGFSENIVKYCLAKKVPIIPGTSSSTDVEAALRCGLSVVKFFPAEAAGGLAMIKAMSGPYRSVRFMPTGGIDENNLASYLACDAVIAVGGSFMVKGDWIRAGEFDKITETSRRAFSLMHGFKVEHVGINAGDAENAEKTAAAFAPFGFTRHNGDGSMFLDHEVEIMGKPWYGTRGHICIETNNILRAEAYLASKGLTLIEKTKSFDKNGRLSIAYIDADFGGFAVHLLQK